MVPELRYKTRNTQEAHKSSDHAGLHQMDRGNERDKHGQEVSWVIYKGSHQRAWLPLRLTHPGCVKKKNTLRQISNAARGGCTFQEMLLLFHEATSLPLKKNKIKKTSISDSGGQA